MYKLFILVLSIVIIFSACTTNSSYIDNYDVIEYDDNNVSYAGKNYVLYSPNSFFCPFLSDSSDDRKEYKIDENYIADVRDENLCFIYNDGDILGNWIYKRADIEIPLIINESDKVDCIKLSTATGDYHIYEQEQISVLLNYFSSKEVVLFCENEYSGSIPQENISFYAMSNYYGGAFSLERGAVVVWSDKKFIVNDEKEIALPLAVVDIVLETLQTVT